MKFRPMPIIGKRNGSHNIRAPRITCLQQEVPSQLSSNLAPISGKSTFTTSHAGHIKMHDSNEFHVIGLHNPVKHIIPNPHSTGVGVGTTTNYTTPKDPSRMTEDQDSVHTMYEPFENDLIQKQRIIASKLHYYNNKRKLKPQLRKP